MLATGPFHYLTETLLELPELGNAWNNCDNLTKIQAGCPLLRVLKLTKFGHIIFLDFFPPQGWQHLHTICIYKFCVRIIGIEEIARCSAKLRILRVGDIWYEERDDGSLTQFIKPSFRARYPLITTEFVCRK